MKNFYMKYRDWFAIIPNVFIIIIALLIRNMFLLTIGGVLLIISMHTVKIEKEKIAKEKRKAELKALRQEQHKGKKKKKKKKKR